MFNAQTEKPCVGILPTLFLERPGVARSLHPTHSVAAVGRGAAEYLRVEEGVKSPCSPAGCWGRLDAPDTWVLFIGDINSRNTFLHYVEELYDVPDRLEDTPTPYVILDGGRRYEAPMLRHKDHPTGLSLNFIKMVEPFLHAGIARKGKLGDANTLLCSAPGMARLTGDYLQRNIDLFGNGDPIPKSWYP